MKQVRDSKINKLFVNIYISCVILSREKLYGTKEKLGFGERKLSNLKNENPLQISVLTYPVL